MTDIEGGFRICEETAQMIRNQVKNFPQKKAIGLLAETVTSLRRWTKDDSLWHKDNDPDFRVGGGPGANPRRQA